VDTLKGKHRKL